MNLERLIVGIPVFYLISQVFIIYVQVIMALPSGDKKLKIMEL